MLVPEKKKNVVTIKLVAISMKNRTDSYFSVETDGKPVSLTLSEINICYDGTQFEKT